MTGTVSIQVISGLGSRMRVVLAAVQYCQATGKRLVVDWPTRDRTQKLGKFGASLDELWSGPWVSVVTGGSHWEAKERTPQADIPEALETNGNIKLRSDSPYIFGRFFDGRYGALLGTVVKPTKMLAERIAVLNHGLPRPIIGVHVRAENARADSSKPDWYFSRLRELPPWPVYLATDRPEPQAAFERELGERLICPQRTYDYSRDSIIRVAAELHVLAGCDWVLGSAGSSYTELVAMMRGGAKIASLRKYQQYVAGGRYEDEWNEPNPIELAAIRSIVLG